MLILITGGCCTLFCIIVITCFLSFVLRVSVWCLIMFINSLLIVLAVWCVACVLGAASLWQLLFLFVYVSNCFVLFVGDMFVMILQFYVLSLFGVCVVVRVHWLLCICIVVCCRLLLLVCVCFDGVVVSSY